MSILITDACVNCGACLTICPNGGISRGHERVVLSADLCTECVGFNSSLQCAEVCPIDLCIIRDPNHAETEAVLFERAKRNHGDSGRPLTLSAKTSHHRVSKSRKWWVRWVPMLGSPARSLAELEDA
ncbi:MAG: YfhL family 4Fe-4S dicluster ferredoxin [bacterium]|nr:YfhL family 4Fe-4S dicluster ferredoxin [bacterium]